MTGNRTSNLMVMATLKAIMVGLGIPEDMIWEDTLIYAHLGLDSVETVKLSGQTHMILYKAESIALS